MTKQEWQEKLEFHKAARSALQKAYIAIAEGGAQQYSIGSRSLTKIDLVKIRGEIAAHEKAIAEAEAIVNNGYRRKAVGVVMRDW